MFAYCCVVGYDPVDACIHAPDSRLRTVDRPKAGLRGEEADGMTGK